jgi:hypothetical protein
MKRHLQPIQAKLHASRQFGAHKHNSRIVKDYLSRADCYDPKILSEILTKIELFLKLIQHVYFDTGFGEPYENHQVHVEETVDQILFGSVRTAYLNYRFEEAGMNDKDARLKFFHSGRVNIISHKKQ